MALATRPVRATTLLEAPFVDDRDLLYALTCATGGASLDASPLEVPADSSLKLLI